MNYELAKKLRDAGFPQPQDSLVYIGGRIPNEEFINMPTLEQLIEECSEGFYELRRVNDHGRIYYVASSFEWTKEDGNGDSAREAVANLWLKINKK